ncbi:CRISPR system precrRNA processing endoribonuclease RAMP protein Cas6 [Desulfatitalea tepidiphila]|uniref:CRISPR system precrRNA processing endoribonuclease RAMP protein Cas6 n=1 Tax=Desulfatitalea tepidiphila TaxID=1185843 RepID=UPI0006B51444|nr:CRISPR system precrRNA processing endoribonuclease RAMP protein Cas6 [Desulfatitalea tepidiphila]
MHYGSYQFNCRFQNDARLPVFKGSTLRGVFGRALKQVVCALRRQECPTCLLKKQCLYPSVFEPELLDDTGVYGKSVPPHPFVIQPPDDEHADYPKEAPFQFNLLLFGEANMRLPYFIYAMDRMGRIGIGKRIDGARGAYLLESVRCNGLTIYTSRDQKISESPPLAALAPYPAGQDHSSAGRTTLTFHTPLRLKHQNHLSTDLPFHVLVRAMLRRISSLMAHFNGGEPQLDYTGLVQRAQVVKTVQSTLVWEDWRRYSLRQEQAMLLGGLKGSITYEGALDEYQPLIDFCAKVHLGKQTTFGLGRYTVEAAP